MTKNKYTLTIIDQGNTLLRIISYIRRLDFKIEYMEIKMQDEYTSHVKLTLEGYKKPDLIVRSIKNITGVIDIKKD